MLKSLTKCEHIHLNGFHGCGFTVHHPSNFFSGFATEGELPAMRAHGSWNVFYSNWFPVNIEDFIDAFLTILSLPAHMTSKHPYLR